MRSLERQKFKKFNSAELILEFLLYIYKTILKNFKEPNKIYEIGLGNKITNFLMYKKNLNLFCMRFIALR